MYVYCDVFLFFSSLLHVHSVQKYFYPLSYRWKLNQSHIVVVAVRMLTCVSAYEAFYHAKHNGRKLRWLYNMGQVEIRCHGLSRQHLLVVSAYQCLALMLFNQRQEDTFWFAWYVCFFIWYVIKLAMLHFINMALRQSQSKVLEDIFVSAIL